MSDRYILDPTGEPVREPDLMKWSTWFEAASEMRDDGTCARHVACSERGEPGHEVRVSTVFLGVDHNFMGGQPVLWETLVFNGPLDMEQRRYTSRAEAEIGHAQMVALVEAALEDRG